VAPLPAAEPERQQVLAMLQPDRPVAEPDAAAIVATSGSTGRPRGVVLSRTALTAAATATHARLGGPGTWVLALPEHYVAGLMVLARGLLAGTPPVRIAPDLSDLPRTVAGLTGRRYLSLVPTQLARGMESDPVAAALVGFHAVLVGGSPLAPALRRRAEDRGVAVVASYGMSETSGGCVYDGQPLPGVEVACGPEEAISIRGPVLFSGYRLRPDLTAANLVDGTLLTADRGRWSGGRLEVTGRRDDVVISAGHNVNLAALERLAAEWPGLAGGDVAVVAVPDPDRGVRVVGVTARVAEPRALAAHLAASVPGYAIPRTWVQLPRLPRTAGGKVDRARLRADIARAEPTP